MNLEQTLKYLAKHGTVQKNGQFILTKPMYVFKKVRIGPEGKGFETRVIANLIIPVGARVNPPQTAHLKLRADVAYCWSIASIKFPGRTYKTASSIWSSGFTYRSLKAEGYSFEKIKALAKSGAPYEYITSHILTLPLGFAKTTNECDEGVHFFVESNLARNYL